MDKEERTATTKEAREYLEERKDAKDMVVHNVPLASFHDVRATLNAMTGLVSWPRYLHLHHANICVR